MLMSGGGSAMQQEGGELAQPTIRKSPFINHTTQRLNSNVSQYSI